MIRPFAEFFRRLDETYRTQSHFAALKARLLVGFNLVMIGMVPLNLAKLLWVEIPHVGFRLAFNGVLVVAASASLGLVRRGRLQLAGNVLTILVVLATHGLLLFAPGFDQPLGLALQLFVVDMLMLLFAAIFSSRAVAIGTLVTVVSGHVLFHRVAFAGSRPQGSIKYAADTLLRDGLMAIGLVFCVGFILISLIDAAQRRSEEALRETQQINDKLEQLVSERTRDLEAATRRAGEALRVKSDFLANMSHEIRTPLNGIVATTDLLQRRPEVVGEVAEEVRLIADSGELLIRLIDDILDFSKIESGQLKLEEHAFELRPLVADSGALFAPRAAAGEVQLQCRVTPELPAFWAGDSYRLRQVLLNLLSNAVKFTPAGGRVSLEVKAGAATPVAGERRELCFEVRDTGIGMDAATMARLFERFTQADSSTTRLFGGTGLGLAISHRLAELMGGRLMAESAPGQGALFRFVVPLRVVEACAMAAKTAPTPPLALGLNVLVAEDNPVNLKIVGQQLRGLGCHYVLAKDGEDALQRLQEGFRFDVVLMDCHMPKLDGWEVTRRLRGWAADADPARRAVASIPVIALTAAALREERERCLQAGMTDFLAKPARVADLRRVLLANVPLAAANEAREG